MALNINKIALVGEEITNCTGFSDVHFPLNCARGAPAMSSNEKPSLKGLRQGNKAGLKSMLLL